MLAISERVTFLLLLGANIVFIIGGVGMLSYGIYRESTKRPDGKPDFLDTLESATYSGTWTIMFGIYELLIGALGIVGMVLKKKLLLQLYAGLLGVTLIVNLSFTIAALVVTTQMNKEAIDKIKEDVLRYGDTSSPTTIEFTERVNNEHNRLRCCGWSQNVEENVFPKTIWYQRHNVHNSSIIATLPDSCCRFRNSAECTTATSIKEARKKHVYADDCLDVLLFNLKFPLWMSTLQVFLMSIIMGLACTFTVLYLMSDAAPTD